MHRLNLSERTWKLQGWRPYYWQARRSMETGGIFSPEFGPYPAKVPGSVQDALRKAQVIPDWNVGIQSLQCEWVEHRHWEFFTEFTANELPPGEELYLSAEGLDYSGWILVDCKVVAVFRGALLRHRIDLTNVLNDGQSHRLSILFDIPPEEQGQIGRTSLSRYFKPRFSFSWDWCVRFVPIGIWDTLSLECGTTPVQVVSVTTTTAADLKSGEIHLRVEAQSAGASLQLSSPEEGTVMKRLVSLEPGEQQLVLPVIGPKLWWPNGEGDPYLYRLEIRTDDGQTTLFSQNIGFKHVRWLPCAQSPLGARDLLCEINGRQIFMQGINWTPVQLDYPATDDSSYKTLIALYQQMGCNVLRVWGGAFLEKEIFYKLCDEAGLLVWQEFPLCSAGLDSEAPRDEAVISDLASIARDYVRRRQHHVSLFLWCGGNELQSKTQPEQPSRPLDESHPALAALKEVVESEQPGIRFLPTSPSGPVFSAKREAMGKGIHHHVHGPWDGGGRTTEEWEDYWSNDDSLLRAETGVSGVAGISLIEKYAGAEQIWKPDFDNRWWRHSSAWWLQWKTFEKDLEQVPQNRQLECFVELSQTKQAAFLALAAASCKKRFPACAGFLVWMGHDAFPCPANTSIIDFEQSPKPAYSTLKEVFRQVLPGN